MMKLPYESEQKQSAENAKTVQCRSRLSIVFLA